jgi:hypothetical protein
MMVRKFPNIEKYTAVTQEASVMVETTRSISLAQLRRKGIEGDRIIPWPKRKAIPNGYILITRDDPYISSDNMPQKHRANVLENQEILLLTPGRRRGPKNLVNPYLVWIEASEIRRNFNSCKTQCPKSMEGLTAARNLEDLENSLRFLRQPLRRKLDRLKKEILDCVRDPKYPKTLEARLEFIANSLGGEGKISPRRSRDQCAEITHLLGNSAPPLALTYPAFVFNAARNILQLDTTEDCGGWYRDYFGEAPFQAAGYFFLKTSRLLMDSDDIPGLTIQPLTKQQKRERASWDRRCTKASTIWHAYTRALRRKKTTIALRNKVKVAMKKLLPEVLIQLSLSALPIFLGPGKGGDAKLFRYFTFSEKCSEWDPNFFLRHRNYFYEKSD